MTGVQTCALPICFPVTIGGVDKGVNKAGSSLDKLKGTVGKLGAAFGIAFGVSEVINFGKELFNLRVVCNL